MKSFLFLLLLLPSISHSADTNPVSENSDLFNPFPPGFTAPPDQPEGWIALPPGRPFPSLLSDPRDLKIGIRKNSRNELEADIGGYRSFAGWKGKIFQQDAVVHTGLEGNGYFVMRREGSKFPLLSSDGLIGLYAEAIRGLWLYQIRYTHISAHISDGLFGLRTAIKYSRETLSLRAARQLGIARLYAGYHFLTNTYPTLPKHSFQVGAYSVFPWHWKRLHPFLGTDYKLKSVEEGSSWNIVGGIALVSSLGAPPIRLSVAYLKGHDPRGQFFTEPVRRWSVGLDLDF